MNNVLDLPAYHETYIPLAEPSFSTTEGGPRKLLIATMQTPDQACGKAWRVGRVDGYKEEIAIYRLKTKTLLRNRLTTITLPEFFVIEQGRFISWEQWRDGQREDRLEAKK